MLLNPPKRVYIVYKCTDTPAGQRPLGKAPRAGCGCWRVGTVRKDILESGVSWMAVCPDHDPVKRRRLTRGKVYQYSDKESAQEDADTRNKEGY